MHSLNSAQLRGALAVAGELAALDELTQVPERVPQLLRELISCDHAGHNVIDLESGCSTVVADPPDAVFVGGPELLGQFAEQNPLVVEAKHGNLSALRLSDHISRTEFHRTDLYNHVYKVVGLEHQLVLQFPPLFDRLTSAKRVAGISLARRTRDFSDGDLFLLGAVRPVLTSTLQRLHNIALVRALVEMQPDGELLVLFDEDHVVTWATPEAQEHFGACTGSRLPMAFQTAASGDAPQNPEARPRAVARARPSSCQFVANAYPGLNAMYAIPPKPDDPVSSFERLGLTARQAQVLALLCEGCTTSEVADRLGISQRTVESHLDSTYRTLGVRNRSQAIVAALESKKL